MLFCEKSVELAPENGLYLYRLGSVLQNHGEMHKALDMFEKAQAFGYDAAEKIAALKRNWKNFHALTRTTKHETSTITIYLVFSF